MVKSALASHVKAPLRASPCKSIATSKRSRRIDRMLDAISGQCDGDRHRLPGERKNAGDIRIVLEEWNKIGFQPPEDLAFGPVKLQQTQNRQRVHHVAKGAGFEDEYFQGSSWPKPGETASSAACRLCAFPRRKLIVRKLQAFRQAWRQTGVENLFFCAVAMSYSELGAIRWWPRPCRTPRTRPWGCCLGAGRRCPH